MKKIMLFCLMLVSLNCFSQADKVKQKILTIDSKRKIKCKERFFDVDTTVITIRTSDIKKLKNNRKKYKVLRENKLGFVDLKVPINMSVDVYVDLLSKEQEIELIEYNVIGEYVDFIPNDTHTSSQWYLSIINAYKAWDISAGDKSVIVGILDSGTEWHNIDLGLGFVDGYQNIYLNSGEDAWSDPANPTTGNGIDDDGNGLIDDWKGWNYEYNSNDARTSNYHGTFVAGIVGAKMNNSYGVAGIAGGKNTEGVKLLPYCVGEFAPITSVIDDAIINAVDKGVKVIQLSLHISPTTAVETAIDYAISNNVVVVCASGNENSSTVNYPASNPHVIAVGATNQNNKRATFSNYGTDLDIVAPGVDIWGWYLGHNLSFSNGTSFAAPQVSAVVALLFSINPTLTASEVRNIIESTAQKIGGYNYQTTTGKSNGTWNNEMGYGILDAYAAVAAISCLTTELKNETVTTNTLIEGCDINITDVEVKSNSKLTIDAENNIKITKDFKVELGSTLKLE